MERYYRVWDKTVAADGMYLRFRTWERTAVRSEKCWDLTYSYELDRPLSTWHKIPHDFYSLDDIQEFVRNWDHVESISEEEMLIERIK